MSFESFESLNARAVTPKNLYSHCREFQSLSSPTKGGMMEVEEDPKYGGPTLVSEDSTYQAELLSPFPNLGRSASPPEVRESLAQPTPIDVQNLYKLQPSSLTRPPPKIEFFLDQWPDNEVEEYFKPKGPPRFDPPITQRMKDFMGY